MGSGGIDYLPGSEDFTLPPWISQGLLFRQIDRAAELRFKVFLHVEQRVDAEMCLRLKTYQEIQIALRIKVVT